MLKKLKVKFVMINMCLVGIVLLTVFAAVSINTYNRAMEEVDVTLTMAMDKVGENPQPPFEIGRPPGEKSKPVPLNYAAVVVMVEDTSDERNITSLGMMNASMDTGVMDDAVGMVMAAEDSFGKIAEMDLFYMKEKNLTGTKIAFADSSHFDAEIRKTVVTSFTLLSLGLAALFLISLLLANLAVAPVKKAWEQQRRFVADASHELKTPLTVLLANTEIMMSDPEADKEKWLASSKEEVIHMKSLVEDLLFLAKSDEEETAGEKAQLLVEADVSDIVTGVVLQMEPVVFESGAQMKTDVAGDIKMKCDVTQMKQLVHILLDNAVKYCDKDKSISLKLKETSEAIELMVMNTGEQMKSEDLDHIFERFYRSDKARTGEGHGLGLSIAKTIVENHGGTIKAYSGNLSGYSEENMTGTVMTAVFPV